MAVISPYTFADLRTPKSRATNKLAIYQDMVDQGFASVQSWEDGTVPSALIETEAGAITNYQQATQVVLDSGFNEWAQGEALTEHSRQIYANERRAGKRTILRLLLTDGGAGPFTFDPASTSFSVGKGGLLFDGIPDPTGAVVGSLTLPLNGSVRVYATAAEPGIAYNVAVGRVDTFARGILPGVSVTNPSDALTAPGTVPGADPEGDGSLKPRNRSQWGTLGTGSPKLAYEKWVRDSDVAITRVETFRNIDLLDPGTVTVLIAGDAGGLPPAVVLTAQNAVASAQIGGVRIPETARCVVSSAVNRTIAVSGTVYVPGEYNTVAFQTQVQANVRALEKAHRIGAKHSRARLLEAVCFVAGLDPNVIVTVSEDFTPLKDTQLLYYEVAQYDLTLLLFVSV